jgi:hypothetical protein
MIAVTMGARQRVRRKRKKSSITVEYTLPAPCGAVAGTAVDERGTDASFDRAECHPLVFTRENAHHSLPYLNAVAFIDHTLANAMSAALYSMIPCCCACVTASSRLCVRSLRLTWCRWLRSVCGEIFNCRAIAAGLPP